MVTGKSGKVVFSVVGFAIIKSLLVAITGAGYIYHVVIISRFVEIPHQFYTLLLHWQQKRLAMTSLLYIKQVVH
jgi:hypothetical protein